MIDNRIKTFLTLCRKMNYRQTADELHMTQPAVTQHIHFLEETYGCKLFIYDKRTLRMTREAELLRIYAENVQYQEKKLREQLKMPEVVRLSIGATKTIGEFVIPEHVSRFIADDRNALSVEVDNTEHLLARISDGDLDFAIIEGMFDKTKYASTLYREEPFVGICARAHSFAGRAVSFDELWSEHLLLREEGSGTRDIFIQTLSEHSHSLAEFSNVTAISNFGLMIKVLEQTGGITFAYRALLSQNKNLSEFHIKGSETVREFNYVYLDTPFARSGVEKFEEYR